MTALLKPKDQKRKARPAFKTMRDGREVCDLTTKAGKFEYDHRKFLMRARQNNSCCICGRYMRWEDTSFEHFDGRGHGGGHRDDRIIRPVEVMEPVSGALSYEAEFYNGASHFACNAKKASVRMDRFLEQERTA